MSASLRTLGWNAAKWGVRQAPLPVMEMAAKWLDAGAQARSDPDSLVHRSLSWTASLVRSGAVDRKMALVRSAARAHRFDVAARVYRECIALQPTVSMVYEPGMRLARSGEFGDAFSRAAVGEIQTTDLRAMVSSLLNAKPIFHPSRLWLYFLIYNAFQLEATGVQRFKETVNNNYFNWTSDSDIELQIRSLTTTLGWTDAQLEHLSRDIDAPLRQRPYGFSAAKWNRYAQLLALLWEQAARCDRLGLLTFCEEPELGTPTAIRYRDRFVTQDLCNSVIDVNTIAENVPDLLTRPIRVAELGAGSGRIENILLRANPGVRVTIVDIPPALYVSQWYLRNLFPGRRVFAWRDFDDFEQVRAEFEAAEIAFLSPPQVEALPPKIFDGFINICSLQEMTHEQIQMWFSQIDRLCRGWFFTKQYKKSTNEFDGLTVHRADYPAMPAWSVAFDRDNPQNESLFETMYRIG